MNEEKTNKGAEETAPNNEDGNKPKSANILEQVRAERERLEQENARIEKNLAELREIEASRLLSGTAGGHIEVKPKEETPKEYAEKVMRGEIK